MYPEYFQRKDCRLCHSPRIENVFHFPETPIGDDYFPEKVDQKTYPLDLVFCQHCGFLQIPNVVSPELLYKNYIYETNTSLNLSEHFDQYAQSLMTFLSLKEGDLVFEIGCNDGTLLNSLKNLKLKTVGIEPATRIAEKARSKGLTILNDFFQNSVAKNLVQEFGRPNLICANNVLANIDDLHGFFQTIKETLSSQGTFVFESGYMIDLIQNDVIDNIYHEHLSYFSIAPLQKTLEQFSLKLFHAEHVQTKGGSMRYFITHSENTSRPIHSSVETFFQREKELGFLEVQKFYDLEKKHQAEKVKLQELCKKLKSENKKIVGFGASVGVTTLLYYYDVAQYLDYLVDDNTKRHGLFSPGLHLPIFSSQKLIEDKVDYAICFPWRYIKPISDTNHEFKKAGGKFILPLPKLSIE